MSERIELQLNTNSAVETVIQLLADAKAPKNQSHSVRIFDHEAKRFRYSMERFCDSRRLVAPPPDGLVHSFEIGVIEGESLYDVVLSKLSLAPRLPVLADTPREIDLNSRELTAIGTALLNDSGLVGPNRVPITSLLPATRQRIINGLTSFINFHDDNETPTFSVEPEVWQDILDCAETMIEYDRFRFADPEVF